MNKKIWLVTILAVGLLAAVAGGVAWAMLQPDAEVEELQQQQAALFAQRESLSDEERRTQWQEIRDKSEQLSESQRQEFGQSMRQQFMGRMEARIDDYYALPDDQRDAYLDAEIARMEERRQQWEQRRRERESAAATDGGQQAETADGASREGARRDRPDRNDPDVRTERMRRRLDHTTPEQRAKFTAYMETLNARREELGLAPAFRPGWGR